MSRKRKRKIYAVGEFISQVMRAHGYKPSEIYKAANIPKTSFRNFRYEGILPPRGRFAKIFSVLHATDQEYANFIALLYQYYNTVDTYE